MTQKNSYLHALPIADSADTCRFCKCWLSEFADNTELGVLHRRVRYRHFQPYPSDDRFTESCILLQSHVYDLAVQCAQRLLSCNRLAALSSCPADRCGSCWEMQSDDSLQQMGLLKSVPLVFQASLEDRPCAELFSGGHIPTWSVCRVMADPECLLFW